MFTGVVSALKSMGANLFLSLGDYGSYKGYTNWCLYTFKKYDTYEGCDDKSWHLNFRQGK
jgi:hypothetical protein